jgi:hypothetical protein
MKQGLSSSTDSDNTQPSTRSPSKDGKVDNDDDDDDGDKVSNNNTIITAKQVYSLTDNCQLKRVLQQKPKASSPPSSDWTEKIKGLLLPTLRPYQEAAVEWMLQREQETAQTKSDEWKLAWIVVVFLKSQQHAHVIPLYEYKQLQEQQQQYGVEKEENILLFNPFTGWFADSIKQAQSMMMASAATTTTATTDTTTTTREGVSNGVYRENQQTTFLLLFKCFTHPSLPCSSLPHCLHFMIRF